jgi:hypothetical protein
MLVDSQPREKCDGACLGTFHWTPIECDHRTNVYFVSVTAVRLFGTFVGNNTDCSNQPKALTIPCTNPDISMMPRV